MHLQVEPISPPDDRSAAAQQTSTSLVSSNVPGVLRYCGPHPGYSVVGDPLTPTSSTTSSLLGANGGTAAFTPDSSDGSPTCRELPKEYFPYGGPVQSATHGGTSMMNHPQSYLSHSPTQISNAPSYPAHSPTAGDMSQYSQYPQASMPGSAGSYAHAGYNYYNGVTSPQSATQPTPSSMSSQLAPLPLMNMNHASHGGYGASATQGHGYHQELQRQQQQQHQHQHQQHRHFDNTGQIPPPGAKPRVTATLWEDEGSLCFQVEAKGVCVARREDNSFINGTKLLNVAGMTRGRRDGILKSEKIRHVVKIGPMHLKGVWIPYDRALDFANREKITELLYPLFVHQISALLYHQPQNSHAETRARGSIGAALRGDTKDNAPLSASSGPSSAGLHHHHSMNGHMASQPAHSIATHPSGNRPELNRAHTFPTPPTSASAILPPQSNSYDWGSQSMTGSVSSAQPLTIETSLGNTRSMPSTPATTPPANSLQSMPSYASTGPYAGAYSSAVTNTPPTPNQFQTQSQGMARFGPPLSSGYAKTEMGPPSRGNTAAETDHSHSSDQLGHGAGDDGDDHDADYGSRYGSAGGAFNYTPTSTMGSIHGDHGQLSQDAVDTSPQSGPGRITPRNSVSQQAWSGGYNTPPRTATAVNLGFGMGADSRNPLSNGHVGESYAAQGYGMPGNNKRLRDEDDDYKTMPGDDMDALKRRKSNRDSISGAPVGGYDYSRPRGTMAQSAGR